MARYVKRPRPEPTSEEFLVLLILLGPLAYVVRWIWRGMAQFARCSTHQRLNSSKDMIAVAADIDSSRRLLLSGSPKHATSAVTNTSRDSRP